MTKICYPSGSRGKFPSLASFFRYFDHEDRVLSCYALASLVQCNKPYRDHLRSYGMDSLIERLCKEAPQLNDKPIMIDCLREWFESSPIADYDIQCYGINDKVTILGRTFEGLRDVVIHTEMMGWESYSSGLILIMPHSYNAYEDVRIGELYSYYPSFDSSDVEDSRTYRNYIFRNSRITEEDMIQALSTPHAFNFSMIHEQISEENLPILYYSGSGRYMILASSREK